MYLVLDYNSVIISISETIGYQENGNALVHSGTLAIAKNLFKEVVEVDSIPSGVEEMKYCYNADKGFYANSNYAPPQPTADQQIADLQATVTAQTASITALQTAVATALGV